MITMYTPEECCQAFAPVLANLADFWDDAQRSGELVSISDAMYAAIGRLNPKAEALEAAKGPGLGIMYEVRCGLCQVPFVTDELPEKCPNCTFYLFDDDSSTSVTFEKEKDF